MTLDGVLLVDKPAGPTSQDVVSIVKRALGAAKAGHAGTLDPFATGLLLVCLGRATKLAGWLTGDDKSYRATVAFGAATDTDDSTGKEISRADASALTAAGVDAALVPFRGPISQVPPDFSAIQKDGRRMYDLARRGERVEIEPRPVVVHELLLESFAAGPVATAELSMRVSKGTYVRSLARDLGRALGIGAHLTALRRTASGPYEVSAATPLATIKSSPTAASERCLAPDRVRLPMDDLVLDAGEAGRVRHGVVPAREGLSDGPRRVVDAEGRILAIALVESGRIRLERVL
jgi:tRNA pseudouridine55 synthase